MRRAAAASCTIGFVLATGAHAAGPLLACQRRMARAAERVVADRQRTLGACLAGRAPSCARALGTVPSTRHLHRAVRPCLARPEDETIGLDGIGWQALAPTCPESAIATLGDAVACLEQALPCAADVAIVDAIPDATVRLAARGITIDRRCLSPPVCGDGEREAEEQCDDGNTLAGDGCDAKCQVEIPDTCGDGVLDDDEECDDGSLNSDTLPDHCRTSCLDPFCGDGVVDPDEGEDCDPPGTATCDEDCSFVDAFLHAPLRAAGSCDAAIVLAVRRVTRKVQRQVDDCALALARCSLVDDDPSQHCLARAERRCAAAARRRAMAPDRLGRRLARRCREDVEVVRTRLSLAACAAEAAVSRAIPRADELMLTELFELDGDEAFPCIVDLGDLE